MKGALVNIRKGTYGAGGTALTASNLFVFDSEVGGINSVFTYTTDGLVPAPTGSGTIRYLREDGTWGVPPDTDSDTWIALTGTVSGYVTAQGASDTTKYLNGNGQWTTPPDTDTVYTHPTLTARDSGLLSGAVVISRVTSDTNGHVTTVSTRTLTPADIGAEPAFSKNSAFNKDFGTSGSATTVSRSDHTHPEKAIYPVPTSGNWGVGNSTPWTRDWISVTANSVQLQINTGFTAGILLEGSNTGTTDLDIVAGVAPMTVLVAEGYDSKIIPNGTFGIKFIADNVGVLVGALRPL